MRRPPRSTLFPSTTLFRSHALNRLAYGPRPGEVARVAREGVMRWIDRQLAPDQIADGDRRSEEHTSELQSRLHLVCRLLLEKKSCTTSSPAAAKGSSRATP